MEIVAVEGRTARVTVAIRAGAQRLRKIQSDVDRVANLLNRTFREQVNVLIVRVVVILGGFCKGRAGAFR